VTKTPGWTEEQAVTDDEHRFTEIYDACRQRVWAYAVSRAGRQVADEVVSETFAIAWRRLDDVPEESLPWLLGVARNVLRDNFRAEARRESFNAELRTWTAAAEGDIAEHVAERLSVLRAMAVLPEDDREILILIAWQGLTPRDASRVVGCSPAALRVRLHRARKRLMRAIDDAPAGREPGRIRRADTASGPRAAVERSGPMKAQQTGRTPVHIIGEELS
jgi:RNA polymerase sigma factor (sigma-70 family)